MALRKAKFIFLLMSLPNAATAFKLTWKAPDTTELIAVQSHVSTGYQDLRNTDHHLPQRLEEARNVINSFESLPSCAKVATAALMHSCSLPHDAESSDPAMHFQGLDMVASEAWKAYGAGLAVCELMEAQATIPAQCEAFVPSKQNTMDRVLAGHVTGDGPSKPTVIYPQYAELTKHNLDQCITALEHKPQSWTSYSNAKQNAAVICHTLQAELQREQSVNTYEKIIDSLGAVSEHHNHVAHDYENQIVELRAAAEHFLRDLQADWDSVYNGISHDARDITSLFRKQLMDIISGASEAHMESQQVLKSQITDMTTQISMATDQYAFRANAIEQQLSFAEALIEQHIMQSLGKMLQDLGLQHDLVLSNHHAFNELARGITETAMNVTATNNELVLTQSLVSFIRQEVGNASQDVQNLSQSVEHLTNLFGFDLTGVMGKAFVFFACVLVFTPLTFGFWERLAGFSIIGTSAAAFATGAAIGLAMISCFNPANIFIEYSTDVFQDDLTARKHIGAGMLIGAVSTLSLGILHSALTRRFSTAQEGPSQSDEDAGTEP